MEHHSRRPAAVAALVSLFVFAMSCNALPAVLLRAADGLAVSIGMLAQTSAVHATGFLLAAIVGGIVSDRIGKRRVLQTACGLLLAGAAVWSVAPGLPVACVGSALMGLGGGVLESMSSALLSDLFPGRRRFFLNLSQAMYCAGAIVGPGVASWLLPLGVSWRLCFVGIAFAAVLLLVLYTRASLPASLHADRIHLAALRAILGRRTFLLPCLALFCVVLSETGVALYSNAYLQTVHQAPERWAIACISLFWLGMMLGRWLCANIPEHVPCGPLNAALLVVTTGVLALQQWAGSWEASLVLFALTGLAFSGIWPLIVGMSASLNPGYSGTVLGITIAAGSLGCIVAPTFVNTLLAHLPPRTVFPVTALPLLLAAVMLLVVGHCNPVD